MAVPQHLMRLTAPPALNSVLTILVRYEHLNVGTTLLTWMGTTEGIETALRRIQFILLDNHLSIFFFGHAIL